MNDRETVLRTIALLDQRNEGISEVIDEAFKELPLQGALGLINKLSPLLNEADIEKNIEALRTDPKMCYLIFILASYGGATVLHRYLSNLLSSQESSHG